MARGVPVVCSDLFKVFVEDELSGLILAGEGVAASINPDVGCIVGDGHSCCPTTLDVDLSQCEGHQEYQNDLVHKLII